MRPSATVSAGDPPGQGLTGLGIAGGAKGPGAKKARAAEAAATAAPAASADLKGLGMASGAMLPGDKKTPQHLTLKSLELHQLRLLAGAAAVFLAPGRFAPPAMPSPLTGAAGAAGAGAPLGSQPGPSWRRPFGSPAAQACHGLGLGGLPGGRVSSTAASSSTSGSGPACWLDRGGPPAVASAAAPFAGSLTELRSREPQQQLGHVEHLDLFHVPGRGDVVDTVVSITRQNGQPVAIFAAPVSSASSVRRR